MATKFERFVNLLQHRPRFAAASTNSWIPVPSTHLVTVHMEYQRGLLRRIKTFSEMKSESMEQL